MNKIVLTCNESTAPDFCGGYRYFVEEGSQYDVMDFADWYGLNFNEIDAQSIKSVQNAAAQLNPGNWLEVTYEVNQ